MFSNRYITDLKRIKNELKVGAQALTNGLSVARVVPNFKKIGEKNYGFNR